MTTKSKVSAIGALILIGSVALGAGNTNRNGLDVTNTNGSGVFNFNSSGTVTVPNATDTLVGRATTDTLSSKSMSGATNTFTLIPDSATTATPLNTNSSIVERDISGNFTATTITAALTGTASGNTTYTASNHGVVLSGSANAMSVLSPSASTVLPLVSGGSSANPTWALLGIAGGGTNSSTSLNNNRVMQSSGGAISEAAAITASRALISDANGIPTQSLTTSTELGYVSGVTSAIQTQINSLSAAAVPSSSETIVNVGLKCSVSTHQLTCALVQADGSTNCSSGTSACTISFRGTTASVGAYNQRSVTSALSFTLRNGDTLNHQSNITEFAWIYALDDAGTVDLCIEGRSQNDAALAATATQITGSALTSGSTLYCASAHTGAKPIRFIGRLSVTEATAGQWDTAPANVDIQPLTQSNIVMTDDNAGLRLDIAKVTLSAGSPSFAYRSNSNWAISHTATGRQVISWNGAFSVTPVCVCSIVEDNTSNVVCEFATAPTTTNVEVRTRTASTAALVDESFEIHCVGRR